MGGRAVTSSLSSIKGKQEELVKKAVEILAPAGSFESMKAAVAAGADAVYMGGSGLGQGLLRKIPKRTSCWKPLNTSIFMGENCT